MAVGDHQGAEPVDLAEPPDRLAATLEEPGVEIAGDHLAVLARERTRHPPDPAADLDQRLLFDVGRPQAEHGEVGRHLLVAGRDELLEREVLTLLVVEDPPGRADDLVAGRLLFGDPPGGLPRHELRSTSHRSDHARVRRRFLTPRRRETSRGLVVTAPLVFSAMRVGVVGATGQVGGGHARPPRRAGLPVDEIRFFASARSAGTTLPVEGRRDRRRRRRDRRSGGLDIALFSAGATVSRALAPKFAAAGATVIDNSSAFRMDPEVPLIVAEVNGADRRTAQGDHRQPELHDDGVHAGPQAAARRGRPRPAHRSTYQAVSGAGLSGVDELDKQVRETVDRRPS